MPVHESCGPSSSVVQVDTSNGEHLIYHISADSADPTWSLVTESDVRLADSASCASPCTRKWPASPDEIPARGDEQHALGMEFLDGGRLDYEVTKHDQAGTQLAVVKKCTFTHDGSAEEHLHALRVFVQ